MTNYNEQLQQIVEAYRASGRPWPASRGQIAEWAIASGLWEPNPKRLLAQCAEDLARAMREEYITDRQGRRVRAKHAARIGDGPQQKTLWADIRSAGRSHMLIALSQRREQIFGDCKQLKCDMDSYNENSREANPIQLCFDFTADLAENDAMQEVSRR